MRRDFDRDLSHRPLRRAAAVALLAVLGVLSACASDHWTRWDPKSYTVRQGDTVYGIAWRYGIDYRELAGWNNLGSSYRIQPGQVLVLAAPGRSASSTTSSAQKPPPASSPRPSTPPPSQPAPQAGPSPAWTWPAPGPVIAAYGSSSSGKGIDIGGVAQSDVHAAAAGTVVYSGSGLIGYGQLIIVKHNNTFLSAYGHNSTLLVSQGSKVGKGQRIARMGEGPGKRSMLHFEIRVNGKPVDPLSYLPPR